MDDIQFESAIHRLKYEAAQDYSVEEMEYYVMGHKRGGCRKQKDRLPFTRETKQAYDLGFSHGKSQDDFLVMIFRKKLKELKKTKGK